MTKKILLLVLLFLFFFPLRALAAGVLRVAAAADLVFALKKIASSFEKESGVRVSLTFGSTGILARQIEEGAPFDIFFSANKKFVERLEKGGFIVAGTMRPYAGGRIVLAANRASGIRIERLEDLLGSRIRRVAIANPEHAPYGMAARQALRSAGLWERLKEKIVYGENVRQTLMFIQSGNAEAGIVALSVADVPEITSTPIDPALHGPIVQVAAVVSSSKMKEEARRFLDFVNGLRGRSIMKKYGFMFPQGGTGR